MTERDIEQPSPLWCGNDSPHGPHDAANEFGGRNFCTGRPGTEHDEPYEPYELDVDEAADAYADLMVVRLGASRAESIAAFRRMIEAVRQEERDRIAKELRAKFGVTNRAASWIREQGKEQA